jgi:hypothetical protein
VEHPLPLGPSRNSTVNRSQVEDRKSLIRGAIANTSRPSNRRTFFRHDKIAEFFIVQTFLGNSDEAKTRLQSHIGDSRFRGVYFLLATLLPIDAAQQLREDLINYAAGTKDPTVSDTFVQLMRSRKALPVSPITE